MELQKEVELDYLQLTTFRNRANAYLARIQDLGFTTIAYAIGKKVMPQIDLGITELEEKGRLAVEMEQYELAEKDSKMQILLKEADGTLKYTSENAIKLAKFKSEMSMPKDKIKIIPYIPKFDVSALNIFELLAFEGIVIPKMEEPEFNTET